MFDFLRRRRIYLDYASTTPVSSVAIHAMRETEKITGNPSSIHYEGVQSSRSLENSRTKIARELGCKAREIIFTSGITESNNLAILGLARKLELEGTGLASTHWIVSSIEHASVLECFSEIERMGGKISYADPDARGIILPESVANLLRIETVCVSIGWANNEIGVVEPMSSIARMLRAHEERNGTRVVFHSDAGQAPLYLSPHVHTLGVDVFSLGASKLYGPHGVGCLYVNSRAEIAPIILGGSQERGLRAGTENVSLAAGFAAALEETRREREREAKRLKKMRDDFAREIVAHISGAIVNGDISSGGGYASGGRHCLPHILNISIPKINAEYAVLAFDRAGISLSTKSACKAGETVSHVVEALGGNGWRAGNTLRFSMGRGTTQRALNKALKALLSIVPASQSR
ncbi:MAG: cysteine desulfurase family protein [Patescibacteria group bacterium]